VLQRVTYILPTYSTTLNQQKIKLRKHYTDWGFRSFPCSSQLMLRQCIEAMHLSHPFYMISHLILQYKTIKQELIFWVLVPFSLLAVYKRFGGTWCLHPHSWSQKVSEEHGTQLYQRLRVSGQADENHEMRRGDTAVYVSISNRPYHGTRGRPGQERGKENPLA
jgi:hypothetical protein